MVYGLYKSRSASHYDDYGTDGSSQLMAISDSEQDLVDRWNVYVQGQRDQYDRDYPNHQCHWKLSALYGVEIERGKLGASWCGSTGGGYASVSYSVKIKPVEQKI